MELRSSKVFEAGGCLFSNWGVLGEFIAPRDFCVLIRKTGGFFFEFFVRGLIFSCFVEVFGARPCVLGLVLGAMIVAR